MNKKTPVKKKKVSKGAKSRVEKSGVEGATNYDSLLLFAVLILLGFGLVMVYSASSYQAEQRFENAHFFFKNHFFRLLLGIGVLLATMNIPYRFWLKIAPALLGLGIVLLALVVFSPLGVTINGSTRWLRIKGFLFEPSDIMRYALIIYLAKSFAKYKDRLDSFFTGMLPHLALVSVVAVLVVLQPDYDTAAILLGIAFLMFFFAGIEAKKVLVVALSTISMGLIILSGSGYGEKRLSDFLGVLSGRLPTNFQLEQSLAGLAKGFVKGVGLGASEQKYNFLPAPFTDFIYSIIGEEFGLIGTLGVLGLFIFIIFRAARISERAGTAESRLLAMGITATLSIYALLNIAVVVGFAPTTGLPLPFISYGGTALISHIGAVGILLNISKEAQASYTHYLAPADYRARMSRRGTGGSGRKVRVLNLK